MVVAPWTGRISLHVVTGVAATLVAVAQGAAQTENRPGLFKMAPQQREQPVRIASLSLEVRDPAKFATFNGDVHITQGELDLRTNALVVFYADMSAAKRSADGGRNQQQIQRMQARGAVVITQKDQRATGDQADFDVVGNRFTLNGNVVVTRCRDVMRSDRLSVDMTTGIYRMEGRVEGMLSPNARDEGC